MLSMVPHVKPHDYQLLGKPHDHQVVMFIFVFSLAVSALEYMIIDI